MLTGENGILTKANTAKEKTKVAEVIERVQTDILAEQIENNGGNITTDQLTTILKKYFDNVPDELPDDIENFEVDYSESKIKLSDIYKGEISVSPMLGNEAKNNDKYGWKVANYNVTTSDYTTGVWRLYYQDSKNAYLITDGLLGPYNLSNFYTSYENGKAVSSNGKKLNQKVNSLFVETNTNLNVKATAWLTDPEVWKTYANSDATFAIGSPTAELLAMSYNKRANKTNTITVNLEENGYNENTEVDWLKEEENHGIYKNTTYLYWLASPSRNPNSQLGAGGADGCFQSGYLTTSTYRIRPVVCIPTAVFDSKYANNLVDE